MFILIPFISITVIFSLFIFIFSPIVVLFVLIVISSALVLDYFNQYNLLTRIYISNFVHNRQKAVKINVI